MHRGIVIGMLRVRRGWTIGELAAAARVSPRTITRCEDGANLRADQLDAIVQALDVTLADLDRVIDPYVLIDTSTPVFVAELVRAATHVRDAVPHLQAFVQFWDRLEVRRQLPEESR
jgi:transcriptional regulator with XRE-family HTH domain